MKSKTADKTRTSIYLPTPLVDRLKSRADKEKRPLSNLIHTLLEDAMLKRGER